MIGARRRRRGCKAVTYGHRVNKVAHAARPSSSVELEQVLEDRSPPAISARLHEQPAVRKAAKLDRRETKSLGKRTNLPCCAVIVAREEHDSPATMHGRVLVKNRSAQMVEALDQSGASEGLRDDPGRRLSSHLFRGHAVGIGDVDDGLPRAKRAAPSRPPGCDSKCTARKMMSALTASVSFLGMIVEPITAAAGAKLCGSRVVATDTSMLLRANALAKAWPILPKPTIA